MDDIVAFLAARLDEDEAVAKAAAEKYGSPWGVDKLWRITGLSADVRPHDTVRAADNGVVAHPVMDIAATHFARHDPARVLAEVAAKRKLVEFWSLAFQKPADFPGYDFNRVRSAGRWTLRILAAVYADHPDYRDDWRP